MDPVSHDPTPERPPPDMPSDGERRRPRRFRYARRIAVPAGLQAVASLDRIDYADAYRSPRVAHGHSAEAWLRTAFDDAPSAVMHAARTIWRMLGAELAPDPSPGHIFGCRLAVHDHGSATMAVVWRIGLRATIVAQTDDGPAGESHAILATFVHHETAASRRVWRVISPIHRSLSAAGLTLAAWRLARVGPA